MTLTYPVNSKGNAERIYATSARWRASRCALKAATKTSRPTELKPFSVIRPNCLRLTVSIRLSPWVDPPPNSLMTIRCSLRVSLFQSVKSGTRCLARIAARHPEISRSLGGEIVAEAAAL